MSGLLLQAYDRTKTRYHNMTHLGFSIALFCISTRALKTCTTVWVFFPLKLTFWNTLTLFWNCFRFSAFRKSCRNLNHDTADVTDIRHEKLKFWRRDIAQHKFYQEVIWSRDFTSQNHRGKGNASFLSTRREVIFTKSGFYQEVTSRPWPSSWRAVT
jgi:hypothetical protein